MKGYVIYYIHMGNKRYEPKIFLSQERVKEVVELFREDMVDKGSILYGIENWEVVEP